MSELTRDQIERVIRDGAAWCPSNHLTKNMARMALRTHDAEQRAEYQERSADSGWRGAGEERNRAESAEAALKSILQYGRDTLSGRTDGPDDRAWHRDAVRTMTYRAREALTTHQPESELECERLRKQVRWLEANSVLRNPRQHPISEYLETKDEDEPVCPGSERGVHGEAWYDGDRCSICGSE